MKRKKKNETQVCHICGHEQGDETSAYDAREHTIVNDQDICQRCVYCPTCENRLKNPRRGWDGKVARCPRCHKIHLKEVVNKRKTNIFERRKGITYIPTLKQSKVDFKVKNWARLEKEFDTTAVGNAVRVIEVGIFDNERGNENDFRIVSQSGYSYNRINIHESNPTPRLKKWHPERQRVTMHPNVGWFEGRNIIERHIQKLRGRGWRVVALKDSNGRKDQVRWPDHQTITEEKHETHMEKFDENAGARHQRRLEKIDEKYDEKETSGTLEWLEEKVTAR